jgi:2-dehydropantoate 2-reductase
MTIHTELTSAEAAEHLALRELFDAYAHCERGLRIVGPEAGADAGQALRPNLVMAGELTEPANVVLLPVKATALDQAIADFASAVGLRTVVVPFLNGMAHLAVLSKRFASRRCLAE